MIAYWPYRIKITVLAAQVSGAVPILGYPVYVDLSSMPATFFSHVNSNGSDIRVYKSNNSERVPVEVVAIDTVAKTGELYFKGDISPFSDTDFYIWYGNPSAVALPRTHTYGSDNVWGSNAKLILHLNGNYLDSSPNARDLTGYNSPTFVSGKLSGQALNLDGVSQFARFDGTNPILTNLSSCTMSCWLYKPSGAVGSGTNVLLKAYGSSNGSRSGTLGSPSTGVNFNITHTGAPNLNYTPLAALPSRDVWHYAVGTYDVVSGDVGCSLDGVFATPVNNPDKDTSSGSSKFQVGTEQDTGTPGYLKGSIDEIRILNRKKTNDEILTDINNQSSPLTFYSLGSEMESMMPGPLPLFFQP